MTRVRAAVLLLVVTMLVAAAFVAWPQASPESSATLARRPRVVDTGLVMRERWRVAFPVEVVGYPAADAEGIVVTVGNESVVALDTDGRVAWRTAVQGALASPPRLDGDIVIVAAERAVVALRRASGAVVWSIPTSERGANRANRAVVAGDIVVTSAADGLVLGLERATGAVRWRAELPTPVTSHPAVGAALDAAPVVVVVGIGEWRGLDAATGRELWAGSLGLFGTSSPVVYESGADALAAVATNEQLLAVDVATGALRWTAPADQSELYQVPVIARNGTELLVPDHWGRVTAYDPHDGRRFWKTAGAEAIAEFGEPVLLAEKTVALPLDAGGPQLATPDGAAPIDVPSDGHGVAALTDGPIVVTTWGGATNYVVLYEVRYP